MESGQRRLASRDVQKVRENFGFDGAAHGKHENIRMKGKIPRLGYMRCRLCQEWCGDGREHSADGKTSEVRKMRNVHEAKCVQNNRGGSR